MLYLRSIVEINRENLKKIIDSKDLINQSRDNLVNGDLYIVKNYLPEETCYQIREYLSNVGRNSIPNYNPIQEGAPNFHRINNLDERSYVNGAFHQFCFFPWNQDYFSLYKIFRDAYYFKNLTSNKRKDEFLGNKVENGCVARIACQFYPKGYGKLNRHIDPVDKHQLTVPIVILSKKGLDFDSGGAYVEKKNGEKVILDDICSIGDVIYFSAEMPHGVLPIDPNDNIPWLEFKGRWMLLLSVNKVLNNTSIKHASDLEK